MQIRVVIVDDEELARRGIRARLAAHPDFVVVGECGDADEAVPVIGRERPDLVFLDVQMPGQDGFDLLAGVEEGGAPEIIFVTAHAQYAVRAFAEEALDYLLKPVDDERFDAAIERIRRRIRERREQALARRVAALVGGTPGEEAPEPAASREAPRLERVLVRESDRLIPIATADIDWIAADGDYVRLHVGGTTHLLRESLASLDQRLDPRTFARIHRSTIVNVDRIAELRPWFNGEFLVLLRDGTQLKLSRTYRDRLPPLFGGGV